MNTNRLEQRIKEMNCFIKYRWTKDFDRHKIFISYKYSDDQVKNLEPGENSTVRNYVDIIEKKLKDIKQIYKGEKKNEDLSKLSDNAIWEKLKSRIYDSTITIILISPGMKEKNKRDKDQWISREISYSLKKTSKINKKGDPVESKTNAMLAVILPDSNGSYEYGLKEIYGNIDWKTSTRKDGLFKIIRANTFNKKIKNISSYYDNTTKTKDLSYIAAVRWDKFIKNCYQYINEAWERKKSDEEYNIVKEI